MAGVAAGAGLLLAVTAVANGGDGTTPAPAEVATYCDQLPCEIINNLSSEQKDRVGTDTLMTATESLDRFGIPADECPGATAAYEKGGLHVDAYLGSCPTAEDAADDIAAHPPDVGER
jgi:hypothetical protein